jgi:hypothetical protein
MDTLRKEYHKDGAKVGGIETASQTTETSAKNNPLWTFFCSQMS